MIIKTTANQVNWVKFNDLSHPVDRLARLIEVKAFPAIIEKLSEANQESIRQTMRSDTPSAAHIPSDSRELPSVAFTNDMHCELHFEDQINSDENKVDSLSIIVDPENFDYLRQELSSFYFSRTGLTIDGKGTDPTGASVEFEVKFTGYVSLAHAVDQHDEWEALLEVSMTVTEVCITT